MGLLKSNKSLVLSLVYLVSYKKTETLRHNRRYKETHIKSF